LLNVKLLLNHVTGSLEMIKVYDIRLLSVSDRLYVSSYFNVRIFLQNISCVYLMQQLVPLQYNTLTERASRVLQIYVVFDQQLNRRFIDTFLLLVTLS
jgi:hypothetical protein